MRIEEIERYIEMYGGDIEKIQSNIVYFSFNNKKYRYTVHNRWRPFNSRKWYYAKDVAHMFNILTIPKDPK